MFSFFRKKSTAEPFRFHELGTDMHSHLIPGVDDGSQDFTESLTLIRGLLDLGFGHLITTPHVMQDMYPNTPGTLEEGFALIRKYWKGDLPLGFAAEYFLDDHVMGLMERDEPLLKVTGNKVLVEISFVSRPMGLMERIFNLQMKGYEPILAHPERYTYFHRDPGMYEAIRNTGCLFQCNLLSFSGYYGDMIRDAAEFLVNRDLVDLLGTDLHHQRHLAALREMPFTPSLKKLMSRNLLNRKL